MSGKVGCVGVLELPRDTWVACDLGAGHLGKHSGAHDGKRYWWQAQHARARTLVQRQQRGPFSR